MDANSRPSLLAPLFYVVIIIFSLITFSRWYNRRKRAQEAAEEPWFADHWERNVYNTLLHKPESEKIPDKLMTAALLRRAMEDVKRMMKTKESKRAMVQLLQSGSVGDNLNRQFTVAERELEGELMDVVAESQAYQEGWNQYVFQTASEMLQYDNIYDIINQTKEMIEPERKQWEKRKAIMAEQEEKLRNESKAALLGENVSTDQKLSNGKNLGTGTSTGTATTTTTTTTKRKKAKKSKGTKEPSQATETKDPNQATDTKESNQATETKEQNEPIEIKEEGSDEYESVSS